jgi:predicted transcriptional regulator
MENLKQKIASEIKKLGMIKHTSSDYKMTKYSQEDIIELVHNLVQKEIKEHSIKLMDYLDENDVYKNHQGMFVFGRGTSGYSADSVLELFENGKSNINLSENN